MQFRDHPGVQGKRDAYPFDPRMLRVDEGYNVRELDSSEERAELDELKEQIRSNGVRTPLEVRLAGEDVFIVAGHRRHKVVLELIEEGEDIKSVPVIPEPKGTNEADRTVNLVLSNSGKPLKPLQIAEVVRRLTAFGWDKGQIAKRLGWKTTGSVNNYFDMLGLPEAVKEQVRAGDLSATTARQIVKETAKDAKNDPEFAAKLIAANKEENAKIKGKGKSHKVTAKTIKRDKPKPKPEPKAKPDAEIKDAGTDTVHHQAPAVVATASEPLPPVSQERDDQTGVSDQSDQDIVRVAPAALPTSIPPSEAELVETRKFDVAEIANLNKAGAQFEADKVSLHKALSLGGNAFKDLISALAPFAKIVPDFDPECPDEHVILISDLGHEITAGQCRAAWRAWNAATGGSEVKAA